MAASASDGPGLSAARLPVGGLLALAMTGFIAIMTETAPAGLLPLIGASLGVSNAAAGQLVTLYAAGSLMAAIPLVTATLRWRRRAVLLAAVIGLLVFNTITALSSNYALTLIVRFFAGVAAGLAWGIIAGYARRMVPGPMQGRALAVAMIGTPLALSLGVPAGAFLGAVVGWRLTFAIMSLLTLGLVGWILWDVPDFPGQVLDQRLSVKTVFLTPGIRPVLFVIFAWMVAHNLLYTYVGPFVARAGLGHRVDLVLLAFGAAALLGIWLIGLLVDKWLRASVITSLIVFVLVCGVLIMAGRVPLVIYAASAVWGLTFGGAATLLGTAGADAAGDGIDVAQAMNTTVWNMAIAGGGMLGGLLLTHSDVGSFPWAMMIFLVAALVVAWRATPHGFPAGSRASRLP